MAKVKLLFSPHVKKNGEVSVDIALSHKSKTLFIKTGESVNPLSATISADNTLKLPPTYKQGKAICAKCNQLLMSAKTWCYDHESSRRDCKVLRDELEAFLKGSSSACSNLFITTFDEFMATKMGGTRKVYECTRSLLNKYEDLSSLSFDDITDKWLSKFEAYLSKTNCVNSISIHMRNIRTVFNYARKNDVTTLYPFFKYKIKNEETEHRALSLAQFKSLINAEVDEWQKRYVDLFYIIFGLRGINMADLSQVQRIDDDGYIRYTRAKTHKRYIVKVEPEIAKAIKRNQGKEHLLSFFDTNTDHEQVAKQLSRALRAIGEKHPKERTHASGPTGYIVKPKFPNITAYWARHTLASIAYNDANIDFDTISDLLGHSSGLKVTNIYVRRDQKKVDAAMRKVLDIIKQ